MSVSSESPDYVTALARGLDILTVFTREQPELTLSEVASLAGVPAATARRSLLTLEALGYVCTNGRRFLLTPRVLKLSSSFLSSMNMQEVANQHLQEVVDKTGDSSSVAVLDRTDIVYIASVSTKRSLRLTATLGTRYPAYATSLGRALLAHLPANRLDRVLAETEFKPLTSRTVTDPERLRGILRQVRAEGIASIEDELDYGVVSVAMPIFAPDGTVLAAVNCSTSPSRVARDEMVRTRRPALEAVATQITDTLKIHPALVHAILGSRS